MIKLLKKIAIGLLCFILFLFAVAAYLVFTTSGLRVLVSLSPIYLPGTLKVQQIQGRLWDEMSATRLTYQQGDLTLELHQVTINWQLSALIHQQLPIEHIKADTLIIKYLNHEYPIHHLDLSGVLSQQLLELYELHFKFLDQFISIRFHVSPVPPYALEGKLSINPKSKKKQQLSGVLHVNGRSDWCNGPVIFMAQ